MFRKVLTRFLVIFSLYALCSCSSMKAVPDPEEKQNIKIAEINIQLGIAYLDKRDMQRAKQKLLYALQKAPSLPEAWYSMAYYFEVTGNKEQANADYLQAVKLAPQRGDVNNNYGTFLCRTGQYSEAVNYFIRATKDQEYLETAGAYENAGLCALEIPNRKLAMQYFSQALESDPGRQFSMKELNKLRQS